MSVPEASFRKGMEPSIQRTRESSKFPLILFSRLVPQLKYRLWLPIQEIFPRTRSEDNE